MKTKNETSQNKEIDHWLLGYEQSEVFERGAGSQLTEFHHRNLKGVWIENVLPISKE